MGKKGQGVQYNKNKNLQVTFTIRESLYDRFKILCKAQKKMPAAVIKEFIRNYVSDRKDDYEKITDYEH
jgi:predicted DNA-binding protein